MWDGRFSNTALGLAASSAVPERTPQLINKLETMEPGGEYWVTVTKAKGAI